MYASPAKQLEVLFQICDRFWLWQKILFILNHHLHLGLYETININIARIANAVQCHP